MRNDLLTHEVSGTRMGNIAILLLPIAVGIAGAQIPAMALSRMEVVGLSSDQQIGIQRTIARFLDLNRRHQLDRREAKSLFAGEMAEWDAPMVGPLSAPDKLILAGDDLAIARLQGSTSDVAIDVYLYLRPVEGSWRIGAMRSLALTGMLREIRAYLTRKPDRSPEEDAMLRHANLTLSTDRQLIEWFRSNRASIEELRARAASARPRNGPQPAYQRIDDPATAGALARLGASSLTIEAEQTILTIGGMVDNSVGFLHTDGAPPRIGEQGADNYIWIESLGDGWFLFRTT